MAEFDPDKFLEKVKEKKPSSGGAERFNPDKFLERVTAPSAVIDEMHPDISFLDRALVKNLGNDQVSSIKYLQKKYPNLEVISKDGEIVAKRKDEKDYRKLDPSGFDAQDITDLGYDVASGVGSSLATVAGGLAGNLPGAVAAGGASSSGLEALRQQLGQWAGVNENVSGEDVLYSGAFGAASPLLLGSGASLAQAGKASLGEGISGQVRKLGEGITENLSKTGALKTISSPIRKLLPKAGQDVAYSQKGLVGRSLPKIGELASGVSSPTIQTAANNLDIIDSIEKLGLLPSAAEIQEEVIDAAFKRQERLGEVFEQIIDRPTNKQVNIQKALEPLEELKAKLEKQFKTTPNSATATDLKTVQNEINTFFKRVPQAGEEWVDDFGNPVELPMPNNVPTRAAFEMKKQFDTLSEIAKSKDGLKNTAGNRSLAEIRLAQAAKKSADNLTNEIDKATGGKLKRINKLYGEHQDIREALDPFFKSPVATSKKIANLTNRNNRAEYEQMQGIDKILKTDIVGNANLLNAFKNFSNAPWLQIGKDGTTSTTRTIGAAALGGGLGYYIGANSGMGQGSAGVTGLGGAAAGALLGGPKALKFYMQRARNAKYLEDQARKLSGGAPVTKSAINSAWNAMYNEGD